MSDNVIHLNDHRLAPAIIDDGKARHDNSPKELPSAERIKSALIYDPETGIFRWREDKGRMKAGQVAGNATNRYLHIRIDHVRYRAHRLAWKYMTGSDPSEHIDHVNGITTDNRWLNLREATQSQNIANSRVSRNNRSGLKGVHCNKYYNPRKPFAAIIKIDGKRRFLGAYETPEQAHEAYLKGAEECFGQFANGGSR